MSVPDPSTTEWVPLYGPSTPGPQGPQGPPGASFTFTQATLSASWVVVHNLNVFPSVTVVDSGGTQILADVHYDNANQVTLTFGSPTSGKAYLN